jgi:membrane associated rhomboid family serine protease
MLSMRENGRLSVLRILVTVNVAVFLLKSGLTPMGQIQLDGIFGLSLRGISHGMYWQLFTHQLFHATLVHLLVNMVGLWFAGRILENLLGGWRFLLFYLACGISGGIFQLVLDPGPVLIGASGAVCGIVAAFSALYPEMPITALLFFVLPIRMRAKWLGIIVVVASIILLRTGWAGNIGNAAHLGGAAAGYAIVWAGKRLRPRIVRG